MNLVFTGFMGTGKTSVGKIAAEKLGRMFFDTDSMIEDSTGQSISEIFQSSGEEVFRKLEAETVKLAAGMDNIVISCGGGVVINPANMDALRKNGIIINLFASPEHLLERISADDKRPLIARALDPLGEIKKLLLQRKDAYKNCDFAFNTEGLTAQQCAEEILNDENVRKLIIRGCR
ncbi:MAG: shikimate kinase [Endomicrobium sp.]|jgi:shikimate kinase|nr:shikimate kinase [Endomicrobium sp.]